MRFMMLVSAGFNDRLRGRQLVDGSRKRFGERLRLARTRAGISQQEIARRIGVSKQLVSHWETARSEITVFDAVKVASIVGVGIEWLLTGNDGGSKRDGVVGAGPAAGKLLPRLNT